MLRFVLVSVCVYVCQCLSVSVQREDRWRTQTETQTDTLTDRRTDTHRGTHRDRHTDSRDSLTERHTDEDTQTFVRWRLCLCACVLRVRMYLWRVVLLSHSCFVLLPCVFVDFWQPCNCTARMHLHMCFAPDMSPPSPSPQAHDVVVAPHGAANPHRRAFTLACENRTSLRDTFHVTTTCCTSRLFSARPQLKSKSIAESPCDTKHTNHFFATTSNQAPSLDGHLAPQIHFHFFASSDFTKFTSSHAASLILLTVSHRTQCDTVTNATDQRCLPPRL